GNKVSSAIAFPIFCKCSWSWGKTTLTGFETLSGLTLLYVLLKHGGSHKKSGMHPFGNELRSDLR
ncbi:hypothetical protein, partial [uncultured Candidatus Kuenenia sp.]